MTKETVEYSANARADAVNHLTNNGTKEVQVNNFLEANRPSEGSGFLLANHFQTGNEVHTAKKGFDGMVTDPRTGESQSYSIREDYDYKDGSDGKGYHVNLQCGKEKMAFVSTTEQSESAYTMRCHMLGERYYVDGPQEAANWYLSSANGYDG